MSAEQNGKKTIKSMSDSYLKQVTVLKAMCQDFIKAKKTPLEMEISEIAKKSGLEDKEAQRYLYILEGHKLVTPNPEGDFTSKYWKITPDGQKAYKQLAKEFGDLETLN